jgi:hypothetical protein
MAHPNTVSTGRNESLDSWYMVLPKRGFKRKKGRASIKKRSSVSNHGHCSSMQQETKDCVGHSTQGRVMDPMLKGFGPSF